MHNDSQYESKEYTCYGCHNQQPLPWEFEGGGGGGGGGGGDGGANEQ